MVISRMLLLFAAIALGLGLLVVERVIGLPAMSVVLIPRLFYVLRRPEREVFFAVVAAVVAVVFAVPASIATVFVLATLVVRPVALYAAPSALGGIATAGFTALVLVSFALVAQVSYTLPLLLYGVVAISFYSWWMRRERNSGQSDGLGKDSIVLYT